jgi:multiple antibiotic resistance protein
MGTVQEIAFSFVTLLAMINPIEAAAAFDVLTSHDPPDQQRQIALRATVVATIILLGFGFAGEALLHALGITFSAFRIAGGLLLLRVGFNMVFAQQTDTQQAAGEQTAPRRAPDPSVFPLAIPIITGPGALTIILAFFERTDGHWIGMTLICAISVVVMAITYGTMRASEKLTKLLGDTGVDAIGRLAGILVAAIAIQLIITGIAETTHGIIVTPAG